MYANVESSVEASQNVVYRQPEAKATAYLHSMCSMLGRCLWRNLSPWYPELRPGIFLLEVVQCTQGVESLGTMISK